MSETPVWLSLPFDWYIENWPKSAMNDVSLRRQKHVELGRAYAAIGHEGRMPYAMKAYAWLYPQINNTTSSLPSITQMPQDLLTEHERQVNSTEIEQIPVWIRTDYGPGTNERFQEMLRAFDEHMHHVHVMDDVRYDRVDDQLDTIFAFCPFLLGDYQLSSPSFDEFPFESEEVQNSLFAIKMVENGSVPKEDGLARTQMCFFITDTESMRTDFVHWVRTDQYDVPLLDERIQPWTIHDTVVLRIKNYLHESREAVQRGWYGDDPRRGTIVWPWTPPGNGDHAEQRILDALKDLTIQDCTPRQTQPTTTERRLGTARENGKPGDEA